MPKEKENSAGSDKMDQIENFIQNHNHIHSDTDSRDDINQFQTDSPNSCYSFSDQNSPEPSIYSFSQSQTNNISQSHLIRNNYILDQITHFPPNQLNSQGDYTENRLIEIFHLHNNNNDIIRPHFLTNRAIQNNYSPDFSNRALPPFLAPSDPRTDYYDDYHSHPLNRTTGYTLDFPDDQTSNHSQLYLIQQADRVGDNDSSNDPNNTSYFSNSSASTDSVTLFDSSLSSDISDSSFSSFSSFSSLSSPQPVRPFFFNSVMTPRFPNPQISFSQNEELTLADITPPPSPLIDEPEDEPTIEW
ncbi:uncharacterized protein ASCRUDRAFT_118687 [Ascoidea rubescens DSM 1968]|uniref:Uncharacterized protein n=1 Tax=Ascoidea rubescens DSM 1968 TaxID=1344418 RepID=A0A1D2VAN8_9ASCO|nr:hypothetical protein ASCRUDRAFT_118687 [Ascoidea rubescens DSM 1968]ODV58734.1 hypothetical protein ASCRUDRAFT_118687 [Ascoidea rubescens DSM 1968]